VINNIFFFGGGAVYIICMPYCWHQMHYTPDCRLTAAF